MKKCHACQSDNEADAAYCTSCGARLNTAIPVQKQGPQQKLTRAKPVWKVIAGGCLAVVLVVGLTSYVIDAAKRSAVREVKNNIPKITEIIPKSKEEAARIVDVTIGDDRAVGELKGTPDKFSSKLKEVEDGSNYQYKKVTCTDLLTDTFQQGAYIFQGELANITQLSVEEENKIGRALAKELKKQFGSAMDKDKQWLNYVEKLGRKLVTRVNRPGIDYHFHVIHDSTINAFAIPGGGIYAYTGLLQKVENEAQLAAILAHEIKHVDLRHCIFVFQMIQQLPEAMQNPYLFTAGKMITNPYSARQEADADRRGVDLIYSFGYSPYQIVAFWQNLAASDGEEGTGTRNNSSLSSILGNVFEEVDNVLRSHPRPAKRVCLLKNYIVDLTESYPMKRVYIGEWNRRNKKTMFEKTI